MTFTPISRWDGMPSYFNVRAADAVYDVISKMAPDEAEVAADLLVGELFQQDLLVNVGVVEKAITRHVAAHGEQIRKGLVRSYISKRQHGESVDDLLAAAEIVSKAQGDDKFNRNAKGRFASVESRAARAREKAVEENEKLSNGEYVRTHQQITYSLRDENGRPRKAVNDKQAERSGIKPSSRNLSESERLAYQQAYRQVAATVSPYARRDQGDHFMHLHSISGEQIRPVADFDAEDFELPRGLRSISISRIPDFQDDFDPMTAARALGVSFPTEADENGNNAGTARIRQFGDDLRAPDHLDRAGTRVMRRMGAASNFLDESFGDSMPRSARAAVKAGKVVGLYGPEAQNVVGPAADKAAYRYRGTERAPDRRLTNTLEAIRRAPGVNSPADAREMAVHGIETDAGWRPSGVLNYFRGRLPDANLNTLQRKSGTIPPSEGVMFDKTGKVVTQAVGYGDDHYLPFNLKNLKPLRGGEYIRTRSWGGPTTEDVYTGLVAGAKSMSVVSHNGVYTVEFDESFKGSRRYNDKAARMVARYGQLLDAVKNGEITTGQLDPNRMAEIEASAESSYDPDTEPREFRAEVDRLTARERRNPTFSAAQRAEAAQTFLDAEALKHRTPDGHEMTREELMEGWLNEQAGKEIRAAREQGIGGMNAADVRADIARSHGLTDPDSVRASENMIRAMGQGDRFQRFVEREEQTYRASLRPLELNGPGYEMALNALREQFPYYINDVQFHPWSDAKNGRDTGYVMPKHNRPAAALSGYFAEELGGKVKAHTTRGQNRNTAPTAYVPRAKRVEQAAAARSAGTATGTGGRPGAPVSPAAQRELGYRADLALAQHIKEQTRFGTGMKAGSTEAAGLEQGGGQDIGWLPDADLRKVAPAVHELRGMSTSDLEALSPDELARRVAAAKKQIDDHQMFDLKSDVVEAHRNRGVAPTPKKFDITMTSDNLRNLDKDRDFGGAVLSRQDISDPRMVLDAYAVDAKVQRLGLPPLDDEGFGAAFDIARDGMKRRDEAKLNWEARRGPKPARVEELGKDIEGLARAAQYRRRFDSAAKLKAEAEAPAQVMGAGGGSFTLQGPGGENISIGFSPAEARARGGARGTITPVSDQQVHGTISAMEDQFR